MLSSPARLFAVLALWLTGLAAWRPLAVPDEGRYTDVARWMLRSGDWVVPRLNGQPFLHKPPLYYWLEAGSMALLGTHLPAARLASLCGALMLCWATYALVRRGVDERAARWAVLLLATNPLLVLSAQYANLDMLVAGCISATIALAVLAHQAEPPQRRWLWWAAYAVAALGVLAKGLIGIVLPGGVFVLWALLERDPRRVLGGFSVVGLLLAALIAAPWFVATEHRVPGFLHFFFTVQHLQRFTETGFNNAWGPWFYPAVVTLGLLPWSPLLWPALRNRSTLTAPASSLNRLAIAWFLIVMVFFSIPRSKLVGYILPLLPAVAILLAPWVARWRHRAVVAGLGAAGCAVLVGIATVQQNDDAGQLARTLKQRINPADQIVFWDRYDQAVPVVLDRATPAQVVADWSPSSHQLPDNWRRELAEGREFEPASAAPLMSRSQWLAQVPSHPGITYWVWADRSSAASDPWLSRWPVVQSRGKLVVVRVSLPAGAASQPKAQ